MADPIDLLTLEEGYQAINDPKSESGVSGGGAGGHDAVVARWITGVSDRIGQLCGPVVQRNVEGELHNGGRPFIVLDEDHAASVTTITEYRHTTSTVLTEETNASKPSDGYMLDPIGGGIVKVRRRTSGSDARFPSGRRNIEVDYVAGRFEDTASVGPLFKTAASSILRRLFSREAGSWATGTDPFEHPDVGSARFYKAVDPMIAEFLSDEMRIPAAA